MYEHSSTLAKAFTSSTPRELRRGQGPSCLRLSFGAFTPTHKVLVLGAEISREMSTQLHDARCQYVMRTEQSFHRDRQRATTFFNRIS